MRSRSWRSAGCALALLGVGVLSYVIAFLVWESSKAPAYRIRSFESIRVIAAGALVTTMTCGCLLLWRGRNGRGSR